MITPQPGVVIAGRYALVRPLAQGGMGSVWIARHRDLEVDVTVKFMAPMLVASSDARARFEREARVAARLDSQYVVKVLDYGVEDGTPYIAMEWLRGESLHARLAREGRLPLPVAGRLLIEMCKALRTAHEAGLVHRDLKPANVFLALKDGDQVVKVLDFGIAKVTDLGDAQAQTESGMLLGSVHYMSPEQIRSSRTVDARSDLWSLGVILYRVLTGRLPFPGDNVGDVLVRVCTDPVPPPTSVAPDLPAWLDELFARALARDPDLRFQSAMELAEGFGTTMRAGPSGPPPSAVPRWKKTLLMGVTSSVQTAAMDATSELPTRQMLSSAPPPAMGSAAEGPTLAVEPAAEASAGTFRAVQVAPRVELSPDALPPPTIDDLPVARVRWQVWVAAALFAAAAAIGGLALVSGPRIQKAVPPVGASPGLAAAPSGTGPAMSAEPAVPPGPAAVPAASAATPAAPGVAVHKPAPPRENASDIIRDPWAEKPARPSPAQSAPAPAAKPPPAGASAAPAVKPKVEGPWENGL